MTGKASFTGAAFAVKNRGAVKEAVNVSRTDILSGLG